jgi:phosphatidylethanolamine/phosphatidyl-N-methylethanolamine N-methyltransferase
MLQAVRKSLPEKYFGAPAQRRRAQSRSFIGAWMRAPFATGAVVPSSRWLARAMAGQVKLAKPGAVIELGAGTGAVTQALLATGIAHDRLLIIERDPKLFSLLHAHYHDLKVLCADAMKLDDVLASLEITRVNTVVSSLPLLSMPKPVRRAIEQQMAIAIGKTGRIVQFTYGPKSPIGKDTLKKYKLKGRRTKMVIANVPPAHVWVYHRG